MPAPRTYEITVTGALNELCSAFAPHTVVVNGAVTTIRVEAVDQATLFGVIGLVQELGLDLREVRIV